MFESEATVIGTIVSVSVPKYKNKNFKTYIFYRNHNETQINLPKYVVRESKKYRGSISVRAGTPVIGQSINKSVENLIAVL
jgi:hypothetical protein